MRNKISIVDDSDVDLLSWKSKIQQLKDTLYFSISRKITRGNDIKKGDIIKSFLAEDQEGRLVIVSYFENDNLQRT